MRGRVIFQPGLHHVGDCLLLVSQQVSFLRVGDGAAQLNQAEGSQMLSSKNFSCQRSSHFHEHVLFLGSAFPGHELLQLRWRDLDERNIQVIQRHAVTPPSSPRLMPLAPGAEGIALDHHQARDPFTFCRSLRRAHMARLVTRSRSQTDGACPGPGSPSWTWSDWAPRPAPDGLQSDVVQTPSGVFERHVEAQDVVGAVRRVSVRAVLAGLGSPAIFGIFNLGTLTLGALGVMIYLRNWLGTWPKW